MVGAWRDALLSGGEALSWHHGAPPCMGSCSGVGVLSNPHVARPLQMDTRSRGRGGPHHVVGMASDGGGTVVGGNNKPPCPLRVVHPSYRGVCGMLVPPPPPTPPTHPNRLRRRSGAHHVVPAGTSCTGTNPHHTHVLPTTFPHPNPPTHPLPPPLHCGDRAHDQEAPPAPAAGTNPHHTHVVPNPLPHPNPPTHPPQEQTHTTHTPTQVPHPTHSPTRRGNKPTPHTYVLFPPPFRHPNPPTLPLPPPKSPIPPTHPPTAGTNPHHTPYPISPIPTPPPPPPPQRAAGQSTAAVVEGGEAGTITLSHTTGGKTTIVQDSISHHLTLVKTGRVASLSSVALAQHQQQRQEEEEEEEALGAGLGHLDLQGEQRSSTTTTTTTTIPSSRSKQHLDDQQALEAAVAAAALLQKAPSPYGDTITPELLSAASSPNSSANSSPNTSIATTLSGTSFVEGQEEEKGHSPVLSGGQGQPVSPVSPRCTYESKHEEDEDRSAVAPSAASSSSSNPSPPTLFRRYSGPGKMYLPHEASELEQDAEHEEEAAAVTAARSSAAQLLRAFAGPTPPPPSSAEQVRVHALTLKELAIVDENPPALLAPRLSPVEVPGAVAHCRAAYGKAGRAKAFRGPAAQVKGPVVLYGEDVLAEAELLLPSSVDEARPDRAKWVRALGVFDGHGMHGKEAARLAAEKFIDDMRRTTMQTLGALLAGDVARVKHIEHERYRLLEAHLEQELRSPTGGTTGTTVQFHTAAGKTFMVVSNVGDSPVLLIDNKTAKVQVLTGRHSWDNPEERQKYLDRCAALGLVPRDVVYGRINCGGMRLEDVDGLEEPMRMYLPGTAEICVKTREHLCKQVEKRFRNSIGGSQSIRRFVLERQNEASGEWEVFRALEEHAHVNWGATILVNHEGKIQMSRSLGDSQEKLTAYIWAEPDVAVYEFQPGEDVTVVACSDGVSDLWYFHEMGEMAARFFADGETGGLAAPIEGQVQVLAQLILDQTIERGEATPGYGIGPRTTSALRGESLKRPMWDDLSVHCARIQT